MGIKSIKIVNLLSFDELIINDIIDINCIIGKNNTGKSNLLKLIRYFYDKLEEKKVLPPSLHSPYSAFGTITIVFDTTKIKQIVTSERNKSNFLKHIYNKLFKNKIKISPITNINNIFKLLMMAPQTRKKQKSTYTLTLKIYGNESMEWSVKDRQERSIIFYLYPFFEVETRHINLHDWENLWYIISKLKSFNISKLKHHEVVGFFDSCISDKDKPYSDYLKKIDGIIDTSKYSYREKVLNYIKVGMKGQTFMVSGEDLFSQSDGTNSYKYIELLLTLLITLTRREYITPTVYIDEPEVGLHPKRSEELIYNLYTVYESFKKTKAERELGRYKTPYPKIILSTHSPNIIKYVIKLFNNDQIIYHFSKKNGFATRIKKMNSHYEDKRFNNIFSDNEARLFFSSFILFVEGATELELFSNLELLKKFPILKNIDIFINNDLTLKYTNPSYSNLSIPYLVVFDADKLLNYDVKKSSFTFLDSTLKISDLYSKVNRSYYGSEEYYRKKHIENHILNNNKNIRSCSKGINFTDGFKFDKYIKLINNYIFNKYNYQFMSTTIEGSIISHSSILLFNKWLVYEYLYNCNLKDNPAISKIISKQKIHLKKGSSIESISKNLFVLDSPECDQLVCNRRFIKKVKYKYLNNIKLKINLAVVDSAELVIIYRLIFNGKTDTLMSVKNEAYKRNVDSAFINLVEDIRNKCLPHLDAINGKTGGWVSRFLNFSISDISKDCNEQEFVEKFSVHFPEIYDTIQFASDSIE